MIVTSRGAERRVVAQADHAALAADLLALVRSPGLVGHPRRCALLAAVRRHDDGWWEADAAPRLAADRGGPLDFRGLSTALRLEIWTRSVERHAGADPYTGALVATHFLRLADPAWSDWVEATRARRAELAAAAALPAAELDADADWLALADQLSLAAVAADARLVSAAGWRARFAAGSPDELALDPFPFAGPTRLRYGARHLPARPWTDVVELGVALAGAPWQRPELRLAPLGR